MNTALYSSARFCDYEEIYKIVKNNPLRLTCSINSIMKVHGNKWSTWRAWKNIPGNNVFDRSNHGHYNTVFCRAGVIYTIKM